MPRPSSSILIVTSGPLCRNPRPCKEATSLSEAGYDVTVLTVATHDDLEQMDRAIVASSRFKKRSIELRPGAVGNGTQRFATRAATWAARKAARFGLESPHAFGPFIPLRNAALDSDADLTIVHTEVAFCVARKLLAAGRRVAADFEDWHSRDLLPAARRTRPLRLLQTIEMELIRTASYTSTTSHVLANELAREYGGIPPVVITNSFPLQPHTDRTPNDSPPAFFWYSQTIGPGRGLEEFAAAWARMRRKSRLCLLGNTAAGFGDHLRRIAGESAERRIEFLDTVAPSELPSLISRHDIGLALEPQTPTNKDLTISNKILQYFNAGLPVIATPTRGQQEVLEAAPNAGLLIAINDPDALSRNLDALVSDPGRIAAMGRASRNASVERFCWEKESPKLLVAVEHALHDRKRKP